MTWPLTSKKKKTLVISMFTFVTASYRLTLEEETADGETPLTLATQAGLVEIVRTLLEHGASPHRTNSRNESPLLLGTMSLLTDKPNFSKRSRLKSFYRHELICTL